eukprot:3172536-Amphidinium_carterae.2
MATESGTSLIPFVRTSSRTNSQFFSAVSSRFENSTAVAKTSTAGSLVSKWFLTRPRQHGWSC